MVTVLNAEFKLHQFEWGSGNLGEDVESSHETVDSLRGSSQIEEIRICSVNVSIDCGDTGVCVTQAVDVFNQVLPRLPLKVSIDYRSSDDSENKGTLLVYPELCSHLHTHDKQDSYLFKCTVSQQHLDHFPSSLLLFASSSRDKVSSRSSLRGRHRVPRGGLPRYTKHIRCRNTTLSLLDSTRIVLSFDLLCRFKLDAHNNFSYEVNRLLDTLFSPRSDVGHSVVANSVYIQKLFRNQISQYTKGRLQKYDDDDHAFVVSDNIEGLRLTLLPFQKRSVKWMLEKETLARGGKHNNNDDLSSVNSILDYLNSQICYGYEVLTGDRILGPGCLREAQYFWNKFTGYITNLDTARAICKEYQNLDDDPSCGACGVLAEEMGLGKTIEILALILLNRRPLNPGETYYRDYKTNRLVRRVKTTLIICPNSLLLQWISEILDHTVPGSLQIFRYLGAKEVKEKFQTQDNDEIINKLADFDIIITTYKVINKEVHYAQFNPNIRSRRSADGKPRYDYTSPLVLMDFFRIILDEVQMLRSNSTQAAKCTSLLHRVHTWGVSGTPVQHIRDIQTILGYLRFHPFCDQTVGIVSEISDNVAGCKQVTTLANGINFTLTDLLHLFSQYDLIIGHSKREVIDQIKIPRQTKYLIPLEFNPIEWDNYLQSWTRFLAVSGYGPHGEGTTSLNSRQLNTWLLQLRQLCCHAIVQQGHLDSRHRVVNNRSRMRRRNHYAGSHNQPQIDNDGVDDDDDLNGTVGSSTGARLYNLVEILDKMIASSRDTLSALIRENFQLQIRKAQVYIELNDMVESGIELLKSVNRDICGKLRSEFGIVDPFNDIKFSTESDIRLNSRIRSYLDLLHQCYFFIATGYYLMGSKRLELVDEENEKKKLLKDVNSETVVSIKYTDVYSSEEIRTIEQFQKMELENYELAEALRKLILKEQNVKVQRIMDETKELRTRFARGLSVVKFEEEENFAENWTSLNSFRAIGQMINALNSQALQFNEFSAELLNLLYGSITKEYTKENMDNKAQEYASSIEDQDKIFAYLHCLEELLQNRSFVVNSDEEEIKLSSKSTVVTIDPTYSKFHVSLIKRLKIITRGSSLKVIFGELKNSRIVSYSLNKNNKHKRSKIQSFEDYLLTYEDYIPVLKTEIAAFKEALKKLNTVYNAKLEYYSHLQRISDSLVSIHELGDREKTSILGAIEGDKLYTKNQERISQTESRIKYLSNLGRLRELMDSGKSITCTICLSEIFVGSMVRCGHFFCKDCICNWLKHHATCPICKRETTLHEIYNFKFRNESANVGKTVLSSTDKPTNGVSETNSTHEVTTDRTSQVPSPFRVTSSSPDLTLDNEYIVFEEINEVHKMTIRENFGAKVDFVVKLILFLKLKAQRQREDPPQILIYSQNIALLKVIAQILDLNRITYLPAFHNSRGISSTLDRFKHDPNITCLLLTISSLSSGLNLLNARHIFFLDPIINHNEELQAMSRNNRIGQNKETFVWNFMIRDTVEESIFKYKAVLENNRRMHTHETHHVAEDNDRASNVGDGDESSEGEDEADNGSDFEINEDTTERVADKHLWHCFFQT